MTNLAACVWQWLVDTFGGWNKPICFLRGRSSRWPTVRKKWLIDHPKCAVCSTTKACEVHHKYPVHWPDGWKTELDESNFITLCRPHHYTVGHLDDWSSRNPNVEQDCAEWNAKIEKRPYPPKVSY